jgi:hypothetical protein
MIAKAVQDLLIFEDRIATFSYRFAAYPETKTPSAVEEHERDIDILTRWYLKTGLAAGPHEAQEMIRDIVEQGRRQAPGRPRTD